MMRKILQINRKWVNKSTTFISLYGQTAAIATRQRETQHRYVSSKKVVNGGLGLELLYKRTEVRSTEWLHKKKRTVSGTKDKEEEQQERSHWCETNVDEPSE